MNATGPPQGRRRDFLRSFAMEAKSVLDEACGVPQLRLDEIRDLPEEKLRQIIPVVMGQVELGYAEGNVVATIGESPARELFPSDSAEMEVFNRFDGSRNIDSISEELAASGARQPCDAYDAVVRLFLRLVDAGICVPANPIS